jgi:pimeloyl-ACP methyl ester carboxylesterase
MKLLKKILLILCTLAVLAYAGICTFLYYHQEQMIFPGKKLAKDFRFSFSDPFEEVAVRARDGKLLSGALFKTSGTAKGLIFYLHGNGGALDTWGNIAMVYTGMGYDIFILDYRGYGKSEGTIENEQQFLTDVQYAYNSMKRRYAEDKITVIGYSIGTGPATMIAAGNKPLRLLLLAPYYSLADLVQDKYPLVPSFALKYKIESYKFLGMVQCPVSIFHGDNDAVIYYGSSIKLSKLFKPGDRLITLNGWGHGGINENGLYQSALRDIMRD